MVVSSQWNRAIELYEKELLEKFKAKHGDKRITNKRLLDGASNWDEYSRQGRSLPDDESISRRVMTPANREKRVMVDGKLSNMANKYETWYELQGRALMIASINILERETRRQSK